MSLQMILKKKKNIFATILFVVLFIITMGIMGCNRISSTYDSDENEIEQEQIADAEHDVLWEMESYYDNDLGTYIQIAETNRADEYIAFTMDEEDADVVEYGAGSYYPESYWKGVYTIEDLSQNAFLSHEYRADDTDENAAYIADISEMEDEGLYYSYGDRSKGYLKGSYIKENYENCREVRVYDISSYLGSD
ncbi:MAG: hypothetical protein ACI4DO_01035 [Roseburia sp.]